MSEEALNERRALKDRLLEAALQHVPFDGWSRQALTNAAQDQDIDAATARRLFPQGGDSLLDALEEWADRQMLVRLADRDLAAMKIRQRIALLVRTRLEVLTPHREAMRRAVAARLMPRNALGGGRAIWRTVDFMWTEAGMAGSPQEGMSYYTRRGLLSLVYGGTFFHWLDDHSEGSRDSWAFLDRRVDDVLKIGKLRATVEGWFKRRPGFGRAR